MSKRLVDTIRQERSQSQVESGSIASIFPPYRSDSESDTSSESDDSSPRLPCSIDRIFPPTRSPSQSPPRISNSTETFFPPGGSPSQSDDHWDWQMYGLCEKGMLVQDHAVFVGDGNSWCVPTSTIPSKSNRIYFTDDQWDWQMYPGVAYGGYDVGVF